MALNVGRAIFRKRQAFRELAASPRGYELEFCVVLPNATSRISAKAFDYEMFCAARRARRMVVRRLAALIDHRPIDKLIPVLRIELHNVMLEVFEKKMMPQCNFEGKIDWRSSDNVFVISCLPCRPPWADNHGWSNIRKVYRYAFYHSYVLYRPL